MKNKRKSLAKEYGWQSLSQKQVRLLKLGFIVAALPVFVPLSYFFVKSWDSIAVSDQRFFWLFSAFVIVNIIYRVISKDNYWPFITVPRFLIGKLGPAAEMTLWFSTSIPLISLFGVSSEATAAQNVVAYLRTFLQWVIFSIPTIYIIVAVRMNFQEI